MGHSSPERVAPFGSARRSGAEQADAPTTYRFILENDTVTGVEIAMPEKILFKKVD